MDAWIDTTANFSAVLFVALASGLGILFVATGLAQLDARRVARLVAQNSLRVRTSVLQTAELTLHDARIAVSDVEASMRRLQALIDVLSDDLDARARVSAELEAAIARNEQISAISQQQTDAMMDEVLDRLEPRERRSLWATFWITAIFGAAFFVAGVVASAALK